MVLGSHFLLHAVSYALFLMHHGMRWGQEIHHKVRQLHPVAIEGVLLDSTSTAWRIAIGTLLMSATANKRSALTAMLT